jgi:hypothetical protein
VTSVTSDDAACDRDVKAAIVLRVDRAICV